MMFYRGSLRLSRFGTVSVVDNVYEPCACTPIGKLKKTSRPYAPGGTVYWTIHSYDSLGRTVSTVAPDGVFILPFSPPSHSY
jgi:hypothetical protein